MKYHNAKRIKGNKYRVDGDTTYILLQDGQECIVDTDDFFNKDLAHFTWTLDHKDPKQGYGEDIESELVAIVQPKINALLKELEEM